MKTKVLNLICLGILALIFIAGFGNAAMTLYPNSYSANISQSNSSSFVFKIYNDGGAYGNYTLVDITSEISNLTGTAGTIPSTNVLMSSLPLSITNKTNSSNIGVTINIPSNQAAGIYNGIITINGKHNETGHSVAGKNINLTIRVTAATTSTTTPNVNEPEEITACNKTGNPNSDLKIRIKNIDIKKGFGNNEDWFPLDNIEIEVKVENRNRDYSIRDITVGWGLYDKNTKEWYTDDEANDFKLKHRKDKTLTFSLKLDDNVNDLENGDYVFYTWANGEISDDNNTQICASAYKKINLIIENDFVILYNMNLPETVSCGSEVPITAEVWNVGDNDQNDVAVVVYNKKLGINEKINMGDIDALENKKLNAFVKIPSDAEEQTYILKFLVYDEDGSIYQNDYNDEEAVFNIPFKISGGCKASLNAMVSANIESGGKAGENLIIKSTITNTGTKTAAYTINAIGYSDWASSANIDQNTFTLNAGESKDITLTFNVNKNASGEKSFSIEVLSGGKTIVTQPVSVQIQKSGFNLFNWGSSKSLIIIVGILAILIFALIVILLLRIFSK